MKRWAADNERAVGAIVPVRTLWELARLWYADRLVPGWRPRAVAESQALFDRVGLTDSFWRLAP